MLRERVERLVDVESQASLIFLISWFLKYLHLLLDDLQYLIHVLSLGPVVSWQPTIAGRALDLRQTLLLRRARHADGRVEAARRCFHLARVLAMLDSLHAFLLAEPRFW